MPIVEPKTITMEINGKEVAFPEGVTVLRAAELNGVFIPSLCSHKDLSPFGSCRLCMVEIEGMRGYPLSCNTIARQGMKVLTDTVRLTELRKDILQLILSEHPSSCLVCDEKTECYEYQGTIRKTGVTTGCKFCPNDQQCELQDLVEKLGITEIGYPIYYHGYETESDDPFYDRDYNVCILCGRCVRMCQEERGTSVLAFTFRGSRAKIAPSFGKSHIEAGCEFCGACVDVCPTGALADKASKWDGKPDGSIITTCPFCGIGCQIEVFHKDGKFSRAKGAKEDQVNDGQLCVRGRFSMPEMMHHFSRARKPMMKIGEFFREVDWEMALGRAKEVLDNVKGEDFLMLVSPDLTCEGLFAAQKFSRDCIGSNNLDSTARIALGGGFELWSRLFAQDISIGDIAKSDVIVAVDIDSRFNFSVVGVQVRRAMKKGASLVTIDPLKSNLSEYTRDWIRPVSGEEGAMLLALAKYVKGENPDIAELSSRTNMDVKQITKVFDVVKSNHKLSIILGPRIFAYEQNAALISAIDELSTLDNINFIPLYFGTNSRAVLELGAIHELIPGMKMSEKTGLGLRELQQGSFRPSVLYLTGEVPFTERPECDFIICQDTYMPSFDVDLFLPACSFGECEGTFMNLEGRLQKTEMIEDLPDGARTGFSRPDWKILAMVAEKLSSGKLEFESSEDVLNEIHGTVPVFPASPDRQIRKFKPDGIPEPLKRKVLPQGEGEFLLVCTPGGFTHRGSELPDKVEGLKLLEIEGKFRFNEADLEDLGLKCGEYVTLRLPEGANVTAIVSCDDEIPRGAIYFPRPRSLGNIEAGSGLTYLFNLIQNPVTVSVVTN